MVSSQLKQDEEFLLHNSDLKQKYTAYKHYRKSEVLRPLRLLCYSRRPNFDDPSLQSEVEVSDFK